MIIQEQIGDELVKTYSDRGVKIHGGEPEADYDEAIDPVSADRAYTETEIPVETQEIPAEEALNIIMGRDIVEQNNGDEISQGD